MDEKREPPTKAPEILDGQATSKSDIEWRRFELDKERLNLEIRKERTAKLQIGLPIALAFVAIMAGSMTEYFRFNLQRQDINGRVELFKKLTEHKTDAEEIKRTYKEIFPRDATRMERHDDMP